MALGRDLSGQAAQARVAYAAAIESLRTEIARTPDDFRLFGPLGIARAGLGHGRDAVASARRGVEVMPVSKDALLGPPRLWELAIVHVKLGDAEAALAQWEKLLEFTGAYSVPLLELEPLWEPLRPHPRHRALVQRYR